MKTKIKKLDFISNKLGLKNYQAYTLLLAVANYSENELCKGRALMYLSDEQTPEYKNYCMSGEGSFMHAVCRGDLLDALKKSDGSNRAALAEAIKNDEIDFYYSKM